MTDNVNSAAADNTAANADTGNVNANVAATNVDDKAAATNTNDTTLLNQNVKTEQPWISDDWRNKLSGGDAKELARLQRFTDINSVYKSYRELEGKISSGALRQEVDVSKFNEAQLAEWRTANGIPAKAEEYQIELPDGVVLGDDDAAVLGSVLEAAHAQNRKPSEVNQLVNAWFAGREAQYAAQIEQQKVARMEAEEQLRQEWHGQTYLTNIAAIKNMLASAPEGLGDMITQARLPDGSLMGTNPTALKWLAQVAMDLNPAGTVVPGDGSNQLQSINAEKAELEKLMTSDLKAWRKNDAARARHRELIDAELKLKSRGYA